MKERRQYQRYSVNVMDIHGNILFASNVKILDISVAGVLLKANKRLDIGRNYVLIIEGKGKKLTLQGTVVRSTLSESRKEHGDIVPIYTAGMEFINLSNEKMNEIVRFLKDNITDYQKRRISDSDIVKMSGLRLHVRFHINAPEKAEVHFFDVYKVKKISLGGMLIETKEPIALEDKLPMEMALPENKVVMFLGRIVTCQLVENIKPKRYEIGIEFIEMSEQYKETLKSFIDSLEEKK